MPALQPHPLSAHEIHKRPTYGSECRKFKRAGRGSERQWWGAGKQSETLENFSCGVGWMNCRHDSHASEAASGFKAIFARSERAGGIFTQGQLTSPLTVAPAPTALKRLLLLNGFGTAADEQARFECNELPAHDRP